MVLNITTVMILDHLEALPEYQIFSFKLLFQEQVTFTWSRKVAGVKLFCTTFYITYLTLYSLIKPIVFCLVLK